jgi:carbon storage regulator CsrA
MLVLGRRPDESIIISTPVGEVKITVFSSTNVRLGIEAPENMIVTREEIMTRGVRHNEDNERVDAVDK